MSKKSFYCWYLGFTNAYSLQGHNRILELVQLILKYQNEKNLTSAASMMANAASSPAKVTLQLSENTLTIVDTHRVVSSGGGGQKRSSTKSRDSTSSGSFKSYMLNYENITYVTRLTQPNYADIVTCIVRSSLPNEPNKIMLNLHAFRFDSESTAVKMEQYFNFYRTQFWKKYEKQQLKLQKQQMVARKQNKKQTQQQQQQQQQQQRPQSPSENEHLLNGKLRNSFLKRLFKKFIIYSIKN